MAAFDPLEFLDLADDLGRSSEESRLRTAVGRAYFALHLLARERLRMNSRPKEHRQVKRAVKKQDAGAAGKLKALETWRVLADYRLEVKDPTRANWEDNWEEVRDLAEDILPRLKLLKRRGSR